MILREVKRRGRPPKEPKEPVMEEVPIQPVSVAPEPSVPSIPTGIRISEVVPEPPPAPKMEVVLEAPAPSPNPPEMPVAVVLEYVKPFKVSPPDRWIGYCIDTSDANRAAKYADDLLTQEIDCFDDKDRGIYFHVHSYKFVCVHNEAARGRPRTARFVERAWGK